MHQTLVEQLNSWSAAMFSKVLILVPAIQTIVDNFCRAPAYFMLYLWTHTIARLKGETFCFKWGQTIYFYLPQFPRNLKLNMASYHQNPCFFFQERRYSVFYDMCSVCACRSSDTYISGSKGLHTIKLSRPKQVVKTSPTAAARVYGAGVLGLLRPRDHHTLPQEAVARHV